MRMSSTILSIKCQIAPLGQRSFLQSVSPDWRKINPSLCFGAVPSRMLEAFVSRDGYEDLK